MSTAFFKKKSFYIPAMIVVLVAVFIVYRNYKKANQPPNYEMATVTRTDLVQKVEATGNVESVNDLDLRFETPGTLTYVAVKEGDHVRAGTLLANLNLAALNAQVAQANANLQQHLAGSTDQDIAFYASAVEAARVSLEQAKANAGVDATVVGGISISGSAYANAVTTLQASLGKMDDAITQADNILGIDNTIANQNFKNYLSSGNPVLMNDAGFMYADAKAKRDAARSAIASLSLVSTPSAVESAFAPATASLTSISTLLGQVGQILNATVPQGSLTQDLLDAKKTIITTSRSGVNTTLTSIASAVQAIADAKVAVNAKQAAYDQAVANYQARTVPPREVDVASYRAALSAAVAARDKAVIRAPIDGVIAKVNKKRGELVTSADVAIQMVSPHFEVKVDIPETDVSKLKLNDPVDITLDAFGPETKFSGVITAIDPASTVIQDVVYYKVTVALNDTDQAIKPGMTANVSVTTDKRDATLSIPVRAVRTNDDGSKSVRILENKNQEKSVPVTLGLKDSEGRVEVVSGLTEGQQIIVSTKQ